MKAFTGMNGRIVGKKPISVSFVDKDERETIKVSFGERRLLAIRQANSSSSKSSLLNTRK